MNKDIIYSNISNQLKELSKCQFTKVACIIVNDSGRIISTGVNGTISGELNCCDIHFEERDDHISFTNENEIHAEMNAIEELARSGNIPSSISIYTSLSPCQNCLKHLLGLVKRKGSGVVSIDKIVYTELYHRISENEIVNMKQKCNRLGVELYQANTQSGVENEFQP